LALRFPPDWTEDASMVLRESLAQFDRAFISLAFSDSFT
jgi:hypothetical protein